MVFPAPAPDTARTWLTVVHEVARVSGGRVIGEVAEPGVGRSFYSVPMALGEETVTLLMNPAGRLVACVRGDRPFPANASYLDVPGCGSFEAAGFIPARASAMEAPLRGLDLAGLNEHEAQQVRYHRPDRVGDVVFNWFD